ncbi:MAG: FUSC family membrane protein [Leeuwenhoekiella sp.]
MKNYKIFYEFSEFIKSTDFAKAVIVAIAVVTPIFVGFELGKFELGLAIGVGALLSSPSDINGSPKHKRVGILFSALIAVLSSILGGYLPANIWIQLPVLGVSMFMMAYLAIYGFRGSLVGFSGLFALVLSFANLSTTLQPYERAILIGIGGLWYLFLTTIVDYIFPKKQTEEFLIESLSLTSRYIRTRANLMNNSLDRKNGYKSLLQLQSDLNESHEKLREILINSSQSSGDSPFQSKRLIILIQLIDIFELAMAYPVNYVKMDELFKNNPAQKKSFYNLIIGTSQRLDYIAYSLKRGVKNPKKSSLKENLYQVKQLIEEYRKDAESPWDDGYIMLQNLYDYQEKQVEKIEFIEHILSTKDYNQLAFSKKKVSRRFLTQQDYNPRILIENLSLQSPIFRHALRLAVVVMIGFAAGSIFALQNPYWILLTIIVIMRPNYGLTKSRSTQRIIGTIIGAVIATAVVLLIHNVMLFRILAIISLIFAFATIQKNYRTAAIFITLSVVFVYALLKPNVINVIEFRVVDTVLGAILAAMGNAWLWPTWEFLGLRKILAQAVTANKLYLEQTAYYYEKKAELPTSHKLSRKQAFISTGELNAAMQRMSEEPSSQQKNSENIYELVILNHTFLSALASLSTYIQNHITTEASEHFKIYTASITQNLEFAEDLLKNKNKAESAQVNSQSEAEEYMQNKYNELSRTSVDTANATLQEAQLITEQLKWLKSLSDEIITRIHQIDFA